MEINAHDTRLSCGKHKARRPAQRRLPSPSLRALRAISARKASSSCSSRTFVDRSCASDCENPGGSRRDPLLASSTNASGMSVAATAATTARANANARIRLDVWAELLFPTSTAAVRMNFDDFQAEVAGIEAEFRSAFPTLRILDIQRTGGRDGGPFARIEMDVGDGVGPLSICFETCGYRLLR